MRVICLDVGERRIGVAVSDPLDITAQGIGTIQSKGFNNDAARILEICKQYETDRVLCGLPLNMNGSAGFQVNRIRAFADRLSQEGLKVRFQDERMTTKLARDILLQGNVRREKRKSVIDKLAATFILQSFLDSGGWFEEDNSPKIYLKGAWRMNENNIDDFDMDREDIVTLEDEDGNSVRFEHLMSLEYNGAIYICLVPVDPMEDVSEDELVIMRIEQTDDGQDVYVTIEDETELNNVFKKYLEIAEADEDEE